MLFSAGGLLKRWLDIKVPIAGALRAARNKVRATFACMN